MCMRVAMNANNRRKLIGYCYSKKKKKRFYFWLFLLVITAILSLDSGCTYKFKRSRNNLKVTTTESNIRGSAQTALPKTTTTTTTIKEKKISLFSLISNRRNKGRSNRKSRARARALRSSVHQVSLWLVIFFVSIFCMTLISWGAFRMFSRMKKKQKDREMNKRAFSVLNNNNNKSGRSFITSSGTTTGRAMLVDTTNGEGDTKTEPPTPPSQSQAVLTLLSRDGTEGLGLDGGGAPLHLHKQQSRRAFDDPDIIQLSPRSSFSNNHKSSPLRKEASPTPTPTNLSGRLQRDRSGRSISSGSKKREKIKDRADNDDDDIFSDLEQLRINGDSNTNSNNPKPAAIGMKTRSSSSSRGQTTTSSDSNNYATNNLLAMLESELSNPYVLYLDGTSPGEKDYTYLKFVQTLHPAVLQKYHRVSSWKRNLMSLRFTLEEESNNNASAVSSSVVSKRSSGNNNTRRSPSPDIQALLDAGDFSPLMKTQQHQKTFDVQDSSTTLKQSPREKRPAERNDDNDYDNQDIEADLEEYNKKFYAKKLERWRKNLVKAKKQEGEDSSSFLSDEPLVDFFNDAKDQITQGFQRLSSQTNVFGGFFCNSSSSPTNACTSPLNSTASSSSLDEYNDDKSIGLEIIPSLPSCTGGSPTLSPARRAFSFVDTSSPQKCQEHHGATT